MDVALVIFRVGLGVGALLVGIGLVVVAVTLRPLLQETRALARDARRLARLADEELPALVQQARTVAANAEMLTEDLAVKLEQLRMAPDPLAGRPPPRPVQSADAREDEGFA